MAMEPRHAHDGVPPGAADIPAEASPPSDSSLATEIATLDPPGYTPPSQPLAETEGYLKIVLPQLDPKRPPRRASSRVPRRRLQMEALPALADVLGRLAAPLRQRWAAVAVAVAVIVIVLGTAGFTAAHYLTPSTVATGFCGDLQAGQYDAAYGRLSAALRARYSPEAFQTAAQGLEAGEGRILGCGQDVRPGAYELDPSRFEADGATATATLYLSRERFGGLAGVVRLVHEDGAWRIDSLDIGVLGLPLDAVLAVDTFCRGLRDSSYPNAYAVLGDAAKVRQDAATFAEQGRYRDLIDGAVDVCGLGDVGRGNTTTAARAALRVVRRGTGEHRAPIRLAVGQDGWRIVALHLGALGSDLGPLLIGQRLCVDLEHSDFADGYGLLTATYRGRIGPTEFADDLRPDGGAHWGGCLPNYGTYHVDLDRGSYDARLTAIFPDGSTRQELIALTFERQRDQWKLASVTFK
jgi:hypothetical protein